VEKNPGAEMSAGDELRMEKARILSMVLSGHRRQQLQIRIGRGIGCGAPFASWELTESLVVSDALLQLRSVCALLLAGCCSALPSAGVLKGAREPCPRGRRDEAAACGQPAGRGARGRESSRVDTVRARLAHRHGTAGKPREAGK
jgi:hypothetical protein